MDNDTQKKVIDIVQQVFGQSISNETKELIVSLIIKN